MNEEPECDGEWTLYDYLSNQRDVDETEVEILHCDITLLDVDAIVNAANQFLEAGGGVDGAIHAAAGPKLQIECSLLGGCPTGQAKLTKGYNLPARYVIHTAGPRWFGGHMQEEELLASCYREAFRIAEEKEFDSVAFPALATGIFGFPVERATQIAFEETARFMERNARVKRIIFACIDPAVLEVYLRLNPFT